MNDRPSLTHDRSNKKHHSFEFTCQFGLMAQPPTHLLRLHSKGNALVGGVGLSLHCLDLQLLHLGLVPLLVLARQTLLHLPLLVWILDLHDPVLLI